MNHKVMSITSNTKQLQLCVSSRAKYFSGKETEIIGDTDKLPFISKRWPATPIHSYKKIEALPHTTHRNTSIND